MNNKTNAMRLTAFLVVAVLASVTLTASASAAGDTAFRVIGGDCEVNAGTCGKDGNCTVNALRCNGDCTINLGICDPGSSCYINIHTCRGGGDVAFVAFVVFVPDAGATPASAGAAFRALDGSCYINVGVCGKDGECTVNTADCDGNCDINLGDCDKGAACYINVSECNELTSGLISTADAEATPASAGTAFRALDGRCYINLGVCGKDGECTVNTADCNGDCYINAGNCEKGGTCEVNIDECSGGLVVLFVSDAGTMPTSSGAAFRALDGSCYINLGTCGKDGECTVNAASCNGECTINAGNCQKGGTCDVNISECSGGLVAFLITDAEATPASAAVTYDTCYINLGTCGKTCTVERDNGDCVINVGDPPLRFG